MNQVLGGQGQGTKSSNEMLDPPLSVGALLAAANQSLCGRPPCTAAVSARGRPASHAERIRLETGGVRMGLVSCCGRHAGI